MTSIDPAVPQDETRPHAELISGLLELVGFLTDHPELPIEKYAEATLSLSTPITHGKRTDAGEIGYVHEVARILDVQPKWSGDSHIYATRQFGTRVKIESCGIRRSHMEQYERVQKIADLVAAHEDALEENARWEWARLAVEQGQADEDGGELAEVECANCGGTGRQRDDSPCADCLGKGRVLPGSEGGVTPEAALAETAAFPPPDQACAVCEGSGQGADEFGICDGRPCEHCHGSGARPPVGAAW